MSFGWTGSLRYLHLDWFGDLFFECALIFESSVLDSKSGIIRLRKNLGGRDCTTLSSSSSSSKRSPSANEEIELLRSCFTGVHSACGFEMFCTNLRPNGFKMTGLDPLLVSPILSSFWSRIYGMCWAACLELHSLSYFSLKI